MATREKYYCASTTAELRVLAPPARQEFLAGLQALQPCSMSELGQYLGRLPVSLYYHLRKLQGVGLVIEHSRRGEGSGAETLYQLRAREVRIDPDNRTGENLKLLRKIGTGILRQAMRLEDSAVAELPARVSRNREHILVQQTLRLSRAGLGRINDKFQELLEVLAEEAGEEDEDFYTVTFHLAPNRQRGLDEAE